MNRSQVIINLAPTGMIPTKELTQHVPIYPAEIISDVDRCIQLGANVIHLHARGIDGKPTWERDVYQKLIEGIRELHPKVVLGVSLSGRNWPEFDKRSEALLLENDAKPDMASLTLSSMNFASGPSVNSPETIYRLAEMMLEKGIKPELEIFDLGMVNYALYLLDKGALVRPLYFNFILGNIAGAQAQQQHLDALLANIPEDSIWTAGGIGRQQKLANELGLIQGNGVRVGLEDNYFSNDERTKLATNSDLLGHIVSRVNQLGRQIASAAQAREMLGLK